MSKAPAPIAPPRVAPQASYRRASWQAFGVALSLEMLAAAGLLAWWALHPAQPALRVLQIEIEAPTLSPQPAAELPPPVPPPPAAPPVRTHAPTPHAPAPALPTPAPAAPVVPEAAPTVVAPAIVSTPEPAPVAMVTPAPTPAPAAPPGPSAEYIARVRAAVQAAFVYPPAAAAVGFQGRTRVAFTLRGVEPVGARVLVSSGMGMVDRAALQSVQAARYPVPPPEMRGSDASFEVWVEYRP